LLKKREKKINKISFTGNLKKRWKSSLPILLFVGGFGLLMGLFYAFWLSSWFTLHINPKIASFNASLSSRILSLLGQKTSSSGELIFSSSYSISVARGCDGIEAMAIFVCALLAFPMAWRKKILGVVIGVLILFVLNLIRIVSLFLVGVYYPSIFELMHVEIWQGIFILVSVSLWLMWIYFSTKIKVNAVKKENT
jgi:exosortase H (IPTLxxWG-CTERM-specific)